MDLISKETLAATVEKLRPVLDDALKSAASDLTAIIEGLDGWTLEISIPPIVLKLKKPNA